MQDQRHHAGSTSTSNRDYVLCVGNRLFACSWKPQGLRSGLGQTLGSARTISNKQVQVGIFWIVRTYLYGE